MMRIHAKNVSFVPQPIKITTTELPVPNENESVRKPAITIPVPTNSQLFVPNGFSVKLYMMNLTQPRYLVYTPSGDILVSESRIHRISCLVDSDSDGYPDQRFYIC